MSRPFFYILQAGQRQLIPLMLVKEQDVSYKDSFETFKAEGSYGSLLYKRWSISFVEASILQIESFAELVFTNELLPDSFSVGFCQEGIFKLSIEDYGERIFARSQVYSLANSNAKKLSVFIQSSPGKRGVLLFLKIPFHANSTHTYTSKLTSFIIEQFQQTIAGSLTVFVSSFPLEIDFSRLIRDLQKNVDKFLCLNENIPFLLLEILNQLEALKESPENGDRYIYNENIAYLAAEMMILALDEDWTITKLSRKIRVNPQKFQVIFKKYMGVPVNAFKIMARIEKAKQLLLETGLSIEEISLRIGFFNKTYFSYLFRQKTGLSPSKYRNQNNRS